MVEKKYQYIFSSLFRLEEKVDRQEEDGFCWLLMHLFSQPQMTGSISAINYTRHEKTILPQHLNSYTDPDLGMNKNF